MVARAQLGANEALSEKTTKTALLKFCKYPELADHIGNVADGFTRVRVAVFMAVKVLLVADPAAVVPFLAEGNELRKLFGLFHTVHAKRHRAILRLPLPIRPIAQRLVQTTQALRFNLDGHSQAVLLAANNMAVDFKNHLQIQLPKRLVGFVQGELDRPHGDRPDGPARRTRSAEGARRFMETAAGGTFARKQADSIINSIRANRFYYYIIIIAIVLTDAS